MQIDSPKALAVAALAGIGASLCCSGPLVLVTLGVSGAWISNLTLLEPYRWIFAGLALGSMGYAWRQIYRAPGAVHASRAPPAHCRRQAGCSALSSGSSASWCSPGSLSRISPRSSSRNRL
jgi:hypothetical protein